MTELRNHTRPGPGGWSIPTLVVGGLLAGCGLTATWAADGGGAPASARRAISDPAVVPAGGACRGCRQSHCQGCRKSMHHHGQCRDGHCHPYCPVRPQEFGFYNTQWRRWPGEGIVPVVNLEAATPELPPKSAVPRVDEESPEQAPAATAPADAPPAEGTPTPEAPARSAPEPDPLPTQAPVPPVEQPAAPSPAPAETPAPKAEKSEPKGDLFDESATGPVPRRFVARGLAALSRPEPTRSSVRPATLTYPDSVEALPKSLGEPRRGVPRVPFDPTAEAARLGR